MTHPQRKDLALLALALLVSVMSCSKEESREEEASPGTPVVLISIDTLRSDRLPVYGYTQVETPSIDAFAADAITFERAYCHYPLTLPSHASILSGQLPDRHLVRDNLGYRVSTEITTYLPRELRDLGYATGAAVSTYILRRDVGIDLGFDFFEDNIPFQEESTGGAISRRGDETLSVALEWIRSVVSEPFFFFFHIYEPHAPWEAPEPFASRYPDPYDAEVAAADKIVGDLIDELKRLGVYDRAIIILLSDHGEALGDHGDSGHGILLYREVLQVPLFLKLPGQRLAGTRVSHNAQMVDIYPTIARLLGFSPPAEVSGSSLLDLVDTDDPERVVYSETFYPRLHLGWSDLASLVQGRFHYIHGPDPELYDLVEDPEETKNILREQRRIYGNLREQLGDYNRELSPPGSVDEETRDRLAALGYLTAGPRDASGPLPDPKGELPTLVDLDAAKRFQQAGEHESAAAACRRAVEANPQMIDAWQLLGSSLEQLGRFEESLEAYRNAMDIAGPGSELVLASARVQLDLGQVDEALEGIGLARQEGVINPNSFRRMGLRLAELGRVEEALDLLTEVAQDETPESLNALARVLSEAGRQQEASEMLERVLAAEPDNAKSYEHLGLVHLRLEHWESARDYSQKAVNLDRALADAWNNLGAALYYLGRPQEALTAWEEAVEQDPSQYETLFNIGVKAPEFGQMERAKWALRRFIETAPAGRYDQDIVQARQLLSQLGG
jgi:arylsulfatase A-like enzyme/Tfp pilus assembly protein PilF